MAYSGRTETGGHDARGFRGQPNEVWPELDYRDWQDSCETLHMWMQIVGKVKLVQTPWINHSWHTTLYVTARGLSTAPIPCGERTFQIDFDFIYHKLLIATSDGEAAALFLKPRTVQDFYQELLGKLSDMGINVNIHTQPNEVPDGIPFDRDKQHAAYEPEAVQRFWRILVQADQVLKEFRGRFYGKCSPVHFFWGSFDLAVTRFSGRKAPEHPGGIPHLPDWVTREAYAQEVSSCGFWPGSRQLPEAVFYCYAWPEPKGFADASVKGEGARYSEELSEFVLPYEALRRADDPRQTLLDFFQSSYEAAAELGNWDRKSLEAPGGASPG